MSAAQGYRANPAWQHAHEAFINPPADSAAERLIHGIGAAMAMWAIERNHDPAPLAGGGMP